LFSYHSFRTHCRKGPPPEFSALSNVPIVTQWEFSSAVTRGQVASGPDFIFFGELERKRTSLPIAEARQRRSRKVHAVPKLMRVGERAKPAVGSAIGVV